MKLLLRLNVAVFTISITDKLWSRASLDHPDTSSVFRIGEPDNAATNWQMGFLPCLLPGRVAQLVARLAQEPGIPGSIPGPATYPRFSFR